MSIEIVCCLSGLCMIVGVKLGEEKVYEVQAEFSQHPHSAQHTPPIPTETYRHSSHKTQVHTFRPVCEFCILPNLPRVPHVCPGAHSSSKSFLLEELLWSGERHKRSALCFCMKQQNLPSKQNPFFSNDHKKIPFNPSVILCFHI